MTEGSFKGVEGIKIFTRQWQPAAKPHAVVVISHGFNAHSGQYEWEEIPRRPPERSASARAT
jgi:acylglycerol lipase